MTAPCRFFFRADGSADHLTASITLRDAFDFPVSGCSVSVSVVPTSGTLALCSCGPLTLGAPTDAAGTTQIVFDGIGGRGELGLEVTIHCSGKVGFWSEQYDFSSTDLDGSCEAGLSTNVFDLAIWASGLPPGTAPESDYNCDGTVNIFDLGEFAGGLNAQCGP